jgi:hypothetical protein
MLAYANKFCYDPINKNGDNMTPTDITALGLALFGDPWLEKMAEALGYSTSQLWRVVHDGAPVTRRVALVGGRFWVPLAACPPVLRAVEDTGGQAQYCPGF